MLEIGCRGAVGCERKTDAVDFLQASFQSCAHRSGIDDAVSGVRAVVDAGKQQVRTARRETLNPSLTQSAGVPLSVHICMPSRDVCFWDEESRRK